MRVAAMTAWLAAALGVTPCIARDPKADFSEAIQALVRRDEQKRKDAAEELERVRAQLQVQAARVGTMRQWTQYNFDLERQGKIQQPQKVSKYLSRLQRQKETTEYALLQFRDQSRGAVKSGRALNFFVDECGPAALERTYCRGLSEYQSRQGQADAIEHEVLSGMTGNYLLDEDTIRHIRYVQGVTGRKLTGRLNEKPLDLEHLNSVLRKDEFRPQVDKIANLRERAFAELDKGQPVTPDTSFKLVSAVQSLLDDIRAAKKKQAKQGFEAMRPYQQAERQMLAIYDGASRLIEAQKAVDVAIPEFKSGTIGDLLAHMQRYSLHFDAADDNGDAAYNQLYTLLTKYYLDLRALQEAVSESQLEYMRLAAREREVADVKIGRSVSGAGDDLWGKTFEGITKAIEAQGSKE
jgi:hypothetical protein